MIPSTTETCLLIIDMINSLHLPGRREVASVSSWSSHADCPIKERARMAGVPTIYVNDNFGKWWHDFRHLVSHCPETSCKGRSIVELLHPYEDDYFVLKPKHSGFFATPLELLLKYLEANRLIVTGIAGNSCVLYTAADASMRDFNLCVPDNCTASIDASANHLALEHMKSNLRVDTCSSHSVDFQKLS